MSSETQQVSLQAESFQKARERYLDETKPDSLVKKQIECWKLQWTNSMSPPSGPKDDPIEFTHNISGILNISSEYVVISLCATCCWIQKTGASQQPTSLWFQMRASVELLPYEETRESNISQKLHKQMTNRLSKDDYISNLIKCQQPKVLLEARINHDESNLEERVHHEQDVAEGIRRAIFSQAEATLDVLELLVYLPCLPTTAAVVGNELLRPVAGLADRAKLRLLEDFMCDACELEGEDALVSDLDLGDDDIAGERKKFKAGGS